MRYHKAPNTAAALQFLNLICGRRAHLDWTDPPDIFKRARVVFRDGGPFAVMNAENQVFQDMKKVRNAISHDSDEARSRFEELVRRELTTLPPNITPGRFLSTFKPGAHNRTFLDIYLDALNRTATAIVTR